MAIEYTTTLADEPIRDRKNNSIGDFTAIGVPTPVGAGWILKHTTYTNRSVLFVWQRGVGFFTAFVDYVAAADDTVILVDASSGPVTISLYGTPIDGDTITIKKVDSSANAVVIDGNSHVIDGSATQSIVTQNDAYKLGFQTQWYVL